MWIVGEGLGHLCRLADQWSILLKHGALKLVQSSKIVICCRRKRTIVKAPQCRAMFCDDVHAYKIKCRVSLLNHVESEKIQYAMNGKGRHKRYCLVIGSIKDDSRLYDVILAPVSMKHARVLTQICRLV